MITADARSRLTQQDLELVAACLGGSGAARLPAGSLDAVLERPELPMFLLGASLPGPSPSLLFYVLVRRSFLDAGIDDAEVADYHAALLREFGVRSRATRVDDVDDHEHEYIVDILADLDRATGERVFKVWVHLGNYALWLAGVFPERIAAQRIRRGGPDLSYYDTLGERGFAEASEHRLAGRSGLDDVLRTTAERFREVRTALNRVSALLDLRSSRLAA